MEQLPPPDTTPYVVVYPHLPKYMEHLGDQAESKQFFSKLEESGLTPNFSSDDRRYDSYADLTPVQSTYAAMAEFAYRDSATVLLCEVAGRIIERQRTDRSRGRIVLDKDGQPLDGINYWDSSVNAYAIAKTYKNPVSGIFVPSVIGIGGRPSNGELQHQQEVPILYLGLGTSALRVLPDPINVRSGLSGWDEYTTHITSKAAKILRYLNSIDT
jgi:hypothetical protein